MPEYKILFHENDTTDDGDSIAWIDADSVPAFLAVGSSVKLHTQNGPLLFTIKSVCHEATITKTNELTGHRVLIQLNRQIE